MVSRFFKRHMNGQPGFQIPEEIFVVTNEIHQYLVRNQIEELGYTISDDHLLAEPEGKNTLPAIAWAMQRIRTLYSSATAVVFPSDHILGDSALDQIRAAEPLARKYLVTFGIKPTSPHTGYGYIKPGKSRFPKGQLLMNSKKNLMKKQQMNMSGKDISGTAAYFSSPLISFFRN